jgi:hypothetical protein
MNYAESNGLVTIVQNRHCIQWIGSVWQSMSCKFPLNEWTLLFIVESS